MQIPEKKRVNAHLKKNIIIEISGLTETQRNLFTNTFIKDTFIPFFDYNFLLHYQKKVDEVYVLTFAVSCKPINAHRLNSKLVAVMPFLVKEQIKFSFLRSGSGLCHYFSTQQVQLYYHFRDILGQNKETDQSLGLIRKFPYNRDLLTLSPVETNLGNENTNLDLKKNIIIEFSGLTETQRNFFTNTFVISRFLPLFNYHFLLHYQKKVDDVYNLHFAIHCPPFNPHNLVQELVGFMSFMGVEKEQIKLSYLESPSALCYNFSTQQVPLYYHFIRFFAQTTKNLQAIQQFANNHDYSTVSPVNVSARLNNEDPNKLRSKELILFQPKESYLALVEPEASTIVVVDDGSSKKALTGPHVVVLGKSNPDQDQVNPAPSSEKTLDQVLKKLEFLESRLDKMEQYMTLFKKKNLSLNQETNSFTVSESFHINEGTVHALIENLEGSHFLVARRKVAILLLYCLNTPLSSIHRLNFFELNELIHGESVSVHIKTITKGDKISVKNQELQISAEKLEFLQPYVGFLSGLISQKLCKNFVFSTTSRLISGEDNVLLSENLLRRDLNNAIKRASSKMNHCFTLKSLKIEK